mgnify:CR=1 FL=1
MRTAICGVWHVHAPDYTGHALKLGMEVVGFYEPDDAMAAAFQKMPPVLSTQKLPYALFSIIALLPLQAL